MAARNLLASNTFLRAAVSARTATSSSTVRVASRAFGTSIARSSARPTIQGDGKGDRVNPVSPFVESAGSNPVDKYKDVAGPLHDFGSYITSCKCPLRMEILPS